MLTCTLSRSRLQVRYSLRQSTCVSYRISNSVYPYVIQWMRPSSRGSASRERVVRGRSPLLRRRRSKRRVEEGEFDGRSVWNTHTQNVSLLCVDFMTLVKGVRLNFTSTNKYVYREYMSGTRKYVCTCVRVQSKVLFPQSWKSRKCLGKCHIEFKRFFLL